MGRRRTKLGTTPIPCYIVKIAISLTIVATGVGAHIHPAQADSNQRLPGTSPSVQLTPWVYPVLGPRLSSDYGLRTHPIRKVTRHHHGVDLAAPVGAQVRAIAAGTVIYADPFGGYGNFVVIRHQQGVTSHYGHCDTISVTPGQQVRAGQVIARVGNSGSSTGPHLHLELRQDGLPRDPEVVLPGITE